MRDIKKIIVHCSDTVSGSATAIRAFHMAPPPQGRGWSDIGYHFVIQPTGIIELGRPESEVGAHCEGHNADSIGICLIGVDMFTIESLKAMVDMVRSLQNKYGLPEDQVFCHYEFDTAIAQGKTCPNIPAKLVRGMIKKGDPNESVVDSHTTFNSCS